MPAFWATSPNGYANGEGVCKTRAAQVIARDTVVAWHGGPSSDSIGTFFKDRQLDSRHIHDPQTEYTKKMVGLARKEFLKPGDVVKVWIEGIGTLTNTCA